MIASINKEKKFGDDEVGEVMRNTWVEDGDGVGSPSGPKTIKHSCEAFQLQGFGLMPTFAVSQNTSMGIFEVEQFFLKSTNQTRYFKNRVFEVNYSFKYL